ncbi:BQ5605_C006g03747 [Microbotryum silenes-dioicae]|uniref:BQ5605_C006g03739 protein n=1 Tax=Microbotryum silenes-dioicae TaxID=796604 RepID=A0A2X0P157_9BASI|nr:BQ5605_C017g08297 [Microbotryum silenes-dioicae]SGY53239.1 BQ5605_C006g03739 [Microbotryum silenes-dioicae]SGY53331.1 BQ5605_C006g03747 [Microbotryum silenes-dioicae]
MKPRLPALVTPPSSPGGAGAVGSTGSPRRAMAKVRHASIAIARSHSKFAYFRILICIVLTAAFVVFGPSEKILLGVRHRIEAELASRNVRDERPWVPGETGTAQPPGHEHRHDDEHKHRHHSSLAPANQSAHMTDGGDEPLAQSSSPPSRLDKIYNAVERPVSTNEKPAICKRTLLFNMAGAFRFALKNSSFGVMIFSAWLAKLIRPQLVVLHSGLHGFGSEVLMLTRMAVLAEMFNYSLLVDSSRWNYGSWEAVFQAPALDCKPPPSTTWRARIKFDRKARTLDKAAVRKSWATFDHVTWRSRDNDGLDKALLDTLTSSSEMDVLHHQDLKELVHPAADRASLTTPELKLASQLVPSALQVIFTRQAQSLSALWRLSRPAAVRVRAARANLKSLTRQLRAAQQLSGDASPIIIGMHVRLGDKYKEINRIGPQAMMDSGGRSTLPQATPTKTSHLDDRAIEKYLVAAINLVERVRRNGVVLSLDERPVLLVASDSLTVSTAFAKHKLGRAFNVIDIADLDPSEAIAPDESIHGKQRMRVAENGFDELEFNMLPFEARERVAQGFVRDITILAQVTHGLVMSASSNVGRMLALLGGEEKIEQGLIASVDTR